MPPMIVDRYELVAAYLVFIGYFLCFVGGYYLGHLARKR